MLTLVVLLALAAFVVTLASAMGKAPLWVAVMILVLLALVQIIPIR